MTHVEPTRPADWTTVTMKSVADVRFSSVDKKTRPGERPVRLCNYLDVYTREYIRGDEPFMAATATEPEIAQFGLRQGDVLITKDSETPDDIGIPSVIMCERDDLVCGYHLALLRPDKSQVNPIFLSKQLRLPRLARYFGRMSNGLTRYGLPTAAVQNAALWLPPDVTEQTRIAAVLQQADAAMAMTERGIAKLKLIKAGLLHDLLMRGIDATGVVRPDITTRMIPLSSIADVNPPTDARGCPEDAEVSFVPMGDVSEDGRWVHRQTRPLHAIKAGFTPFREDDVLFAKITPCMENGKGMHAVNTVNGIGFASTEFHVLRAKNGNVARFVYWWTMMPSLRIKAAGRMTGSAGQQRVPADFFDWWQIPYRDSDEQRIIADRLDEMESRIAREQAALAKLHMLKQGLMHDLLTGQVRVPSELGVTAAGDNASDAPRSERRTNIYFMRSVLAAEIVEQMHEHATFGHVKFQKTLFLCERVAGLDLETRYHRAAAGPHDNRLMRSVDGQMKKQKWFRVVPRSVGADGKPVGWAYERMENAGGHREWFEKYWAAARERIQRVINLLRPLDTKRCEVVATLYSAWEDLLAADREATDDAIVNEVLTNWHESKQAIPRDTWIRALGWMRKQELQPATIGTR